MTSTNQPNKRLFIGSIPYKYTEGDLLSLFVTEGKVVSARIIRDRYGKSRGIGYIEYEDVNDAQKAKEKFHQQVIEGRTIIVDYAKPDPLLTPEGRQRHEEALIRRPPAVVSSPKPKKRKNFSSLPKTRTAAFRDKKVTHQRQSVFEQRKFGSRIGAKFSRKSKRLGQKKDSK